jgi:OOP family OmpA-OmpF porin
MKKIVCLLLVLGLGGCSTVYFNRSEVLKKQDNISQLNKRLEQAVINDVQFLSPTNFYEAKQKLEEAINKSQRSTDINLGDDIAKKGLEAIEKAESVATKGRELLEKALENRTRAYSVDANSLFASEFKNLEESLVRAGKHLEDNDTNYVLEQNKILALGYEDLEIRALKTSVAEQAKAAYAQALNASADTYAPDTLKNAKKELDIAVKIIETDKENFSKAQFHANEATYQALKAKGISEVINLFKTQNLSREQIILWYQEQLSKAHEPLAEKLSFDKSNTEVIESFRKHIVNSNLYLKGLEERNILSQKKIAELNDKISSLVGNEEKLKLSEANRIQNFKEISDMFLASEAEVYAQPDDLIIRSYGFDFEIGKADILPSNFALLNKIVTAILKFPKATIEVQGHTDSTGNNKINQALSEKRAQNIKEFLINISQIEPARLTSTGFGSQKPLATNETLEGRAKNRRIEIVIKFANK